MSLMGNTIQPITHTIRVDNCGRQEYYSANIRSPPPPSWGGVFLCPTDQTWPCDLTLAKGMWADMMPVKALNVFAPFSLPFALWWPTVRWYCPGKVLLWGNWGDMKSRPGPKLPSAAKLSWHKQDPSNPPTHEQEINVLSHWVLLCLKLFLHGIVAATANVRSNKVNHCIIQTKRFFSMLNFILPKISNRYNSFFLMVKQTSRKLFWLSNVTDREGKFFPNTLHMFLHSRGLLLFCEYQQCTKCWPGIPGSAVHVQKPQHWSHLRTISQVRTWAKNFLNIWKDCD